jgi:hypothetical protein
MANKITKKRWQDAQKAERKMHTFQEAEGIEHYHSTYRHYFRFVQLGFDLGGLSVIEIGPADFPALRHCKNYSGIIIEPMPSEILKKFCDSAGVQLITEPLEEIADLPEVTEIWLFNVMQHIIDPDKFVQKCKEVAKRIRFFEPINYPVSEYHPHTYTEEDFKGWFGDCVQAYKGGSVQGFHEADCVYGVFINK